MAWMNTNAEQARRFALVMWGFSQKEHIIKSIQPLVDAIKRLEANGLPSVMHGVDIDEHGGYCPSDLDQSVQDVEAEACSALITNGGAADFDAIKRLGQAGWKVTCGERDSFGWLSGVVHTSKGTIVYG